MSLKLEIEGLMLNVVSVHGPQPGCQVEENLVVLGLGWCLVFPLDRGKRRLCAKIRKHRKVFKGKGCHRNSGIVREMK